MGTGRLTRLIFNFSTNVGALPTIPHESGSNRATECSFGVQFTTVLYLSRVAGRV